MRQLTVSFVGMLIIASAGCYQRTNAPILPAVNSDVMTFRQEMGLEPDSSSETGSSADTSADGSDKGEGS